MDNVWLSPPVALTTFFLLAYGIYRCPETPRECLTVHAN